MRHVKVDVKPEESGLERYVAGEHMDTDDLHIRRWGIIGDGYLGPAFHRKFVKGQVLYGSRRTYLRKVAVAKFDGICANTTFVLEPSSDELLPELLPFIMQTEAFTEHSVKQSKGSVNPYINWKDIAWYEFALPPKDKQRRIAEILWAADEVIICLHTVRANIDNLLSAIRENEICDAKHPRRRLDICLSGMVPGRSVVGLNRPATESEFGVLKVSAVGADGFVPEENKALVDSKDFRPEFSVKAGDLLITRANTRELVGRVCITPAHYQNLMLCDKTIRMAVREDVASKLFLLEALKSREVRSQIEADATGTGGAMKNISQRKILNLRIPLPDLDVQQLIVSKIQDVVASKQSVIDHLAQTLTYRNALLNELLMQGNGHV